MQISMEYFCRVCFLLHVTTHRVRDWYIVPIARTFYSVFIYFKKWLCTFEPNERTHWSNLNSVHTTLRVIKYIRVSWVCVLSLSAKFHCSRRRFKLSKLSIVHILVCMMTSSNAKHFPRYWQFVQGIHRSQWIPRTRASDAELWCFLWSAPE